MNPRIPKRRFFHCILPAVLKNPNTRHLLHYLGNSITIEEDRQGTKNACNRGHGHAST